MLRRNMANKNKKEVTPVEVSAITETKTLADRFLAKEVKAVNEIGINSKSAVHLENVRKLVRKSHKGEDNA